MKIQVGSLSEGMHEYSFRSDAAELELGEYFPGEVMVTATVERTGGQFHLRATVETSGAFDCDRCATSFQREIRVSYPMHYITDEEGTERFDPAEVQVLSPGLSIIDLNDDVRQTLLLAIPLKLLCRDDCAGLCPRCGKNLNEGPCSCVGDVRDTPWEQLRRLQSK